MGDHLDELDQLLLDRGYENIMLLSELDGFLAGVAVSPDLIMPSVWLPRIWGSDRATFEDEAAAQRFIELVTHHYNEILACLDQPGVFEPVLDIDTRNGDTLWELWIEGFAAAMALAPDGWNRLRRSDDAGGSAAMAGISQLVSVCERRIDLIEEDERRWDCDAPGLIATWVQMLHEWRLDTDRNRPPGKIGRNDPCPCGSGGKHKKCCGLN